MFGELANDLRLGLLGELLREFGELGLRETRGLRPSWRRSRIAGKRRRYCYSAWRE